MSVMRNPTRARFARWVLFALGAFLAMGTAACELGEEEAPPISWMANRPHRDEGACTDCHTRLDWAGKPLPTITSASRIPHMDRGVCSNCHVIEFGKKSRSLTPVAKFRTLQGAVQTQGSVQMPSGFAPAAGPPSGQSPSRFSPPPS